MISDLIGLILTSPASPSHSRELGNALEQHIDELVAQQHLLPSLLQNLMDAEREAAAVVAEGAQPRSTTGSVDPAPEFAMAMTYLATALSLGGGAREEKNSAILLDVVEQHLLSTGSTAYSQMRGHVFSLIRFGQLLAGYIAILDVNSASNYGRKLYFLHRAVLSFAPSLDHLTIAHALLVQEAVKSHCPRLALSVMRRPVLEISPEETGAGISSFYRYYYEGGFLLIAMECWEDAEEWLRSAMSATRRTFRGGKSASVTVPETLTSTKDIFTLIVLSAKAFILVSLIVHGGIPNPRERKRLHQITQQLRSSEIEPYLQLLSSMEKRDLLKWEMTEGEYASLWKKDGFTTLVSKAKTYQELHVVRDAAKSTSRVFLSTIMESIPRYIRDTGRDDEYGRTRELIQFLLSMMEEGVLQVSFEFERNEREWEKEEHTLLDWLEHGLMMYKSNVQKPSEHKLGDGDRCKSNLISPSIKEYNIIVNLDIPSICIPASLGESRRKFLMICLCGEDLQRYRHMQLCHAMEVRIRRCDRARAALAEATRAQQSRMNCEPESGES